MSVKPGLHVRRKHMHKHKDVYTCDKHKHKVTYASTEMEIVPFSCANVLMLASLCRMCKPGRRKHKHKRKHKVLMLASHRFTHRFLVFMLVL